MDMSAKALVRSRIGAAHYNYFRDYDPAIGRYAQSDPLGLDAALNTYSYVDGNPVAWSDEVGLSKGGKKNINAEGFTKKSDPKLVEKAMNEAKAAGKLASYRALRGLLKVIKRGGTLGLACELFDQFRQCQEDPCGCDPYSMACLVKDLGA